MVVTMAEKISILYTNADQLSNKRDLLQARIDSVDPDIVAVNEVHPKNARFKPLASEFSPEKASQYDYFPNNIGGPGRGQIFFFKPRMNFRRIYPTTAFEESMFLEVSLKRNEKLVVCLIYRSDSGSAANNSALLELLTELCALNINNL